MAESELTQKALIGWIEGLRTLSLAIGSTTSSNIVAARHPHQQIMIARLQDDFAEQLPAGIKKHRDQKRPRGLANRSDVRGVSAECRDVIPCPLKDLDAVV